MAEAAVVEPRRTEPRRAGESVCGGEDRVLALPLPTNPVLPSCRDTDGRRGGLLREGCAPARHWGEPSASSSSERSAATDGRSRLPSWLLSRLNERLPSSNGRERRLLCALDSGVFVRRTCVECAFS